jgi:hypothetical protein
VGWALPVLLCGTYGCGGDAPKSTEVSPLHNNLRTFTLAYVNATKELNRPPRNPEEIKPYLTKLGGNPSEILRSTSDGEELVIQWGSPISKMSAPDGKMLVWVYEKNAHDGKRWVLQGRFATEMTEDEFRNASFSPGIKKPF